MLLILLTFWLLVVSIQLIYILFVFSRTAFYRQPKPVSVVVTSAVPAFSSVPYAVSLRVFAERASVHEQRASPESVAHGTTAAGEAGSADGVGPGVTIIVCAHNEYANLVELLPLLNEQQYPQFDVLVMDDRSTDGTQAYLEHELGRLTHVRFIRVEREHEHVTPKKYALTIALKKARYPTVLLTDADCRPASTDWLARMVAPFAAPSKEIVLGFSPYEVQPGLLNLLIRSETLFTAVQYSSLALAGRPYMGVGRNLAYRTGTFFANRGFYTHKNVLGGDDDLFINEVATGRNTAVCLDPATFTWSKPKETWAAWRIQKRRHLNVGKYYKPGHKLRLGLLIGSHVLTWVLALAVGGLLVGRILLRPGSLTAHEGLLLAIAAGAFAVRGLAFWGIVGRISYRLGNTVHWAAMPLVDLILGVYYGLMGLQTVFTPRTKRYYWR